MGYSGNPYSTPYDKGRLMSEKKYEPSRAEMLASLVIGQGEQSYAGATVQRSHRFPMHLFIQIENLAKHADVPMSLIINELIACGLDALRKELPEDVSLKIAQVTKNQMQRPSVTERVDSEEYRARRKRKPRK